MAKKRQTFGKMQRERERLEKRERKKERRETKRLEAAADAQAEALGYYVPPPPEELDELAGERESSDSPAG